MKGTGCTWVAAAIAVAMAMGSARAAGDAGPTGAAGSPVLEGHGWIPVASDRDSVTQVLHLPPRDGTDRTLGALRWFAPGVPGPVEGWAWWGDRVFLVLAPAQANPPVAGQARAAARARSYRSVLEVQAVRSAIGTWVYPPGRPRILPELPGETELVDVAAGGTGVWAVLGAPRGGERGGDAPWGKEALDGLELRVLLNGSWATAALPWQNGGGESSAVDAAREGVGRYGPVLVRVWADADGFNVLLIPPGASGGRWYAGRPPASAFQGPAPFIVWNPGILAMPVSAAAAGPGAIASDSERWELGPVMFVAGATHAEDTLVGAFWGVAGTSSGDTRPLMLGTIHPTTPRELWRSPAVPAQAWLVSMAASNRPGGATGRIAAVYYEGGREEGGGKREEGGGGRKQEIGDRGGAGAPTGGPVGGTEKTPRLLHVTEVSALTGRVLFDGAAKNDGLISAQRYQTLAVALVLMMACVLAFVLRGGTPAKDGEILRVAFPKGVVPGDPLRRLVAAGIDYLSGAAVAATVLRVPVAAALNPGVFIIMDADVKPVVAGVVLTIVQCTLGEWLFGRTLGKALMGCTTVLVRRGAGENEVTLERPRLWQALVRNIVRWVLPLIGLFVLMEPFGRHPGDQLARTMVVMPEPEGAGGGGPESGS